MVAKVLTETLDRSPIMRAEEPRNVVPECMAYSDGCGPVFELSPSEHGKLLVLTLVINAVLEHEVLFVSIWGSPDAETWGTTPLVSFPPKYYCGVSSILLNLAARPDVRYIRAQWRMQGWKNTTKEVMFDFYVSVELSGSRIGPRTHPPDHGKRAMKMAR
jgi:hypothetical protein